MPREVDADQRLADIAAATIAVARTAGTQAVTIRSVATQLGGSTTLVTNYVRSRAALILNALDSARDRWEREREDALAAAPASGRFLALVEWELAATADDAVLRTFILEVVSNAEFEPDLADALRREADDLLATLRATARESGFVAPDAVADIAYLAIRGAYLANVDAPQHWTETHTRDVIRAAIDAHPRI
ncbi:MAG: hypothetical protein J0I43_03475 [Microbacterium sp.]|uniref:hypothetical protein n=1 Tax=Microbacterium sp. TaxID=51671 RepID=UPI001AC86BF8|nr:hypothetical protein [Microbacterium sp.]MBN9176414.1 hypothetical protein [Microbacterium sp.]